MSYGCYTYRQYYFGVIMKNRMIVIVGMNLDGTCMFGNGIGGGFRFTPVI